MTHGLWVVNSSLLIIFGLALFTNSVLQQDSPVMHLKVMIREDQQKTIPEEPTQKKLWEKIYQNDIFGTFTAQPETKASSQSFVSPIPEPKVAVVIPPPPLEKIDFIAPLAISLKGLIVAADENKSIAIIADEAGKESIYHLGEKIKDAQLIKIANNRVVFIRANGQHETFYLRQDDVPVAEDKKWINIVKKINDQSYEINLSAFKDEVESLGNLIEGMSVIGTAYNQGMPIGMRIGKLEPTDVGSILGLIENDIIISINNIKAADPIERIKIYDTITAMKTGSSFKAIINRAGKDIDISYKFAQFEKSHKPMGLLGNLPTPKTGEDFQMNAAQQHEQKIRDFEKIQTPQRNQQILTDIRKRLFENLHARPQNARVR